MTSWTELRTVALVGTERRELPITESGVLPALPGDLDGEAAVMAAAALLGVARRAGAAMNQVEPPQPNVSMPPAETTAPNEAIQLLELMLSGNAGPGSVTETLFDQWFELCTEHGYVLPHRLLVAVLDRGAASRAIRPLLQPTLGHRGKWLATQRDSWSWAAGLEPEASNATAEDGASSLDLDEILELQADQRDATLIAAREGDPDGGRLLIADACTRLDAASRARVLGCLGHGLSPADEDLLEEALDDRSKAVRAQAIALLNALPESQRARRLARQLEPLVSRSGRLRTTFKVNYPTPPEDEQLRDLPPTGSGVIEQQWFDTLVVGAPLAWWEATFERTPAKILSSKLDPADELLEAWTAATVAQQNREWAQAIFDKTNAPQLLPLIADDAAAGAFLASLGNEMSDAKRFALLGAVPGPWSADFSRAVVDWVQVSDPKKPSNTRLNHASTAMASHLSPRVQPALEHWLDQARGDENKYIERTLRNLIQQLSLRTSITKAFS